MKETLFLAQFLVSFSQNVFAWAYEREPSGMIHERPYRTNQTDCGP